METNTDIRTFFTSDGHLNENGTALYAEALILEKLRKLPRQIAEHVESCDDCKVQIAGVHEIMMEQPLDTSLSHPYLGESPVIIPFPTYLRAAAIFILAVVGGTAYSIFSSRGSEEVPPLRHANTPAAAPIDSTPASGEMEKRTFAENSVPSPNLDDLVHSNFRSETIEVLTPETEAIVSSPITFRWKEYPRPVILKILNNRDITVLTSNVKGNKFVTARSFLPGLYYWKLEDDGELLFVGKFFVK